MRIAAPWFDRDPDEWLREVLRVHFDPSSGSPYWLERERKLGLSVLRDVSTVEDLALLGPMPQEDLAALPLETFLPRSCLARKRDLVLGETGGTTGRIQTTAYLQEEFDYAFVDFLKLFCERRGFPARANWLYLGPSGPHLMFKNAQGLARAFGAMEPFAVDFDSRWIKKMAPGSFGASRYQEHVVDQAERIFSVQGVAVLFTTPVVALLLAQRLPAEKLGAIRGIHLGGMTLTPADYASLAAAYPNAALVPGYGNTLCGVALELGPSDDGGVRYHPPGPRLIHKVIPDDGRPDAERLRDVVRYGERGQVLFHRLDSCFFIANMVERDGAVRVPPHEEWEARGYRLDGVKDPGPLRDAGPTAQAGLY